MSARLKTPQTPLPDPFKIARRLDARGISVRAVAIHLGVNQSHLLRVLRGERPGSQALLDSLAELAETMPGRRSQEDVARLIGAAVHVFFVRRGDFESPLFEQPVQRPTPEEGAP